MIPSSIGRFECLGDTLRHTATTSSNRSFGGKINALGLIRTQNGWSLLDQALVRWYFWDTNLPGHQLYHPPRRIRYNAYAQHSVPRALTPRSASPAREQEPYAMIVTLFLIAVQEAGQWTGETIDTEKNTLIMQQNTYLHPSV
jgi:hypothetical protein